jgi:succinate dehydrogenase/fumarate reductase cytochrome b subunit
VTWLMVGQAFGSLIVALALAGWVWLVLHHIGF